jgi:hypothetical protein
MYRLVAVSHCSGRAANAIKAQSHLAQVSASLAPFSAHTASTGCQHVVRLKEHHLISHTGTGAKLPVAVSWKLRDSWCMVCMARVRGAGACMAYAQHGGSAGVCNRGHGPLPSNSLQPFLMTSMTACGGSGTEVGHWAVNTQSIGCSAGVGVGVVSKQCWLGCAYTECPHSTPVANPGPQENVLGHASYSRWTIGVLHICNAFVALFVGSQPMYAACMSTYNCHVVCGPVCGTTYCTLYHGHSLQAWVCRDPAHGALVAGQVPDR